jgi:hypothetical protein
MLRERNAARAAGTLAVLLATGLAVGGCGSTSSLTGNLFGPSFKSSEPAAGVTNTQSDEDTPCPSVAVRTGASTLVIGSKPGPGEPAPLDVRYQGTIINMARECHLNAGLLTVKVGVEGRILTGPAGGPGTVNVPLRIAVVKEGVNPVTVVTKFTIIPVTVANAIDRVNFTHVESDLGFPIPQPASALDSYVIYVGFDPLAAQPQKKPPAKKPRAKPKPPKQS